MQSNNLYIYLLSINFKLKLNLFINHETINKTSKAQYKIRTLFIQKLVVNGIFIKKEKKLNRILLFFLITSYFSFFYFKLSINNYKF